MPQEDGSVGIQSVHSGNFLRMDGESVIDNAGGVVNCQSFVGFMEKFSIRMWISFSSPFPFPFPPLYLQLTLPSKHKILKREGWCPGKWANQIRSLCLFICLYFFCFFFMCIVLSCSIFLHLLDFPGHQPFSYVLFCISVVEWSGVQNWN